MKKVLSAFLFLYSFSAVYLYAGNDNWPAGARPQAMGGAGVALSDVFAAQNNQAGLARLKSPSAGVFAERKFFMNELGYYSFAAAYPTSSGVFGLSVNLFGFSLYNDKKAGLAFARKFSEKLSAGVQIDYLSTTIEEYGTISSFTFEGGIQAQVLPELMLAAHIFNPVRITVSEFQDEKIPTIMKAGLAYTPSDKLLITAETEKDIGHPARFRVGVEYKIVEALSLRGGAATNPALATFGIGLNKGNFNIDLASQYHAVLGITPGMSVIYSFNKE